MYQFLAFSYFYLKTYGKAFDKCDNMQYFWKSVDSAFDNLLSFIAPCNSALKLSLLCLEISNTNGKNT